MTFRCPNCHNTTGLMIRQVFELPPDRNSDEITMQIIQCQKCDFRGLAVYTEAKRGRLDGEAWVHRGYCIEPEELNTIANAIASCPEPYNAKCQCPVHRRWGGHIPSGDWQGYALLEKKDSFSMLMSDGGE